MENTGLVVIPTGGAMELFTIDGSIESILNKIDVEARKHVPDTSTDKGRKAIASNAYRVSQSKTVLENAGKDLVADWKNKAKVVDSARKKSKDFLDSLRDEMRKPLEEWEEEQKAIQRKKELEESHELALVEHEVYLLREEKRLAAEELERKIEEQAEVDRIEKEKAERIAREKQIADDAAQQAKEEAEKKILAAEREVIAAQEREKIAAKQAEADKLAAVELTKIQAKQAQEAKEAQERVEELARIAEADKVSANKNHQRSVNKEALLCLINNGIDEETAKTIIGLIAKNKIQHITINY